jgi:hypothetical protein
VKLIQIAKSCQNIKSFFKLNNENKIIWNICNNENEDDLDDPVSPMVSISIYFIGYLFIGYFWVNTSQYY